VLLSLVFGICGAARFLHATARVLHDSGVAHGPHHVCLAGPAAVDADRSVDIGRDAQSVAIDSDASAPPHAEVVPGRGASNHRAREITMLDPSTMADMQGKHAPPWHVIGS
jgi:hypothetical protein